MSALRIGMVGGGPGAFIGAVHRRALALDGEFRLVAGAFSADPANSRETGAQLGLAAERVYPDYPTMATAEAELPADQRIQAVAVVTPNHLHHAVARTFLEHDVHVICDKPLSRSVAEAEELVALARARGLQFAVTYNYSGYPVVRELRQRIAAGQLGTLRKVYVEYLQGWLARPLEADGHKQARWRTDPERAGPCGAMGDIGTHAAHLVEFVTGRRITELLAQLHTFVAGRALDDDGMVLLRLGEDLSGTLCASQVCAGRENGLRLQVYGTAGGCQWEQERPDEALWYPADGPSQRLRAGNAWMGPAAADASRLPAGHPEGFLEAFANVYRGFAGAIRGQAGADFPPVTDGLRGMQFLDAVLASQRQGGWVKLASDSRSG